MQEVFIEIWRCAHRFDPAKGKEVTFVATLARRRLIDRLRRKGRRPHEVELVEALPGAFEQPDLAGRMDTAQAAGQALAALESLRPAQRDALQLAVIEGLSHGEVAAATGLPLGTVKTHVRRGLIRLRQLLEDTPAGAEPGSQHETRP